MQIRQAARPPASFSGDPEACLQNEGNKRIVWGKILFRKWMDFYVRAGRKFGACNSAEIVESKAGKVGGNDGDVDIAFCPGNAMRIASKHKCLRDADPAALDFRNKAARGFYGRVARMHRNNSFAAEMFFSANSFVARR